MAASSSSDVFAYLVAIFIPPLAVFLKRGCAVDFLINVCLTILGWIPGVIHAWWVISKHDPAKYQ
ncbi:plasma membrane proteolipid Pmp3 [Mollisiaceae sp. DMI_Dod_QoI]|nr:plasma membrane proteolipid Pmp3 [Helotiales sp. DMI_Dod_QoI]